MALTSRTNLGPYEILSSLGAGGMGEVYRARDTRLERTVAIKILPAHFSSDPVRKQRFEREAKTIATLNHPHICVLHDIGHQDGMDYLVMECVEGETLEKRLEKGPLPVEQVVKIGAEVADALGRAHRSGVVHRDLKPGNIMLTATGAKLLDFGLAKPAAALAAAATTASAKDSSVTQEGTIVGTFQYMSPEQVEGREVDGRSDIFSLGAVLYEMLTGRRAFEGKSQLSVASAILEKEPAPISTIKPMTPPGLDHVVRRCLAKDPEERWQTGRDLAQELKWVGTAEKIAAGQEATWARLFGGSRSVWTLSLALVALATIAIWGWMRSSQPAPRPVMRWATVLPPGYTLINLTLSPDGSHLAYVGASGGLASSGQLYVRATDQLQATVLSGDDTISFPPLLFFSPDSKWIAYRSHGKLKKVPVDGGASITICDTPVASGGAWGPDDTIILGATIGTAGGLSRVSAAGGKLEVLTTPDPQKGETAHAWPYFLPGGKAILFSIKTARPWDEARIAVLDLRTGERRVLLEGGSSPRYVPTGHLIYARGGSLFAVPFDPDRLQVKGTPSPVLEGVAAASLVGFADYSFSGPGDLVYRPGSVEEKTTMVWVDRTGKAETVEAHPRTYANPSISPDGRRVAVSIEAGSPDNWDIWVYDLERRTLTKLTYGFLNFAPAWTPDGKRVMFRNKGEPGKNGIFWAPADGSGPPEQLLATDVPVTPGSWLPDGSAMVFYQGVPGNAQICVLAVQGGPANSPRGPQAVIKNGVTPQLSPDGRWLAYVSSETGISQVYVKPFPSLVGKWQVSSDGGDSPRWARSGRELFYRNRTKMMAVDIETKEAFRPGVPKALFDGGYSISQFGLQPGFGYDVSPDGRRFLMTKPVSELNPAEQLHVVQNWFEELRRRVPTAGK